MHTTHICNSKLAALQLLEEECCGAVATKRDTPFYASAPTSHTHTHTHVHIHLTPTAKVTHAHSPSHSSAKGVTHKKTTHVVQEKVFLMHQRRQRHIYQSHFSGRVCLVACRHVVTQPACQRQAMTHLCVCSHIWTHVCVFENTRR